MKSDIAKQLDSVYNRMQWAGEEYLLEEIEDREEKVRCAQVVGDKYSTISSEEYANRAADKIRVFRLNIEHISGKRLVKAGEPGMGYKKG